MNAGGHDIPGFISNPLVPIKGKLFVSPTSPVKPSKSLSTDPGLKRSECASKRTTKPFFFPTSEMGSPFASPFPSLDSNDLF